ncbi:reverse transcriptase domain-containing protein [Tanacetum coccineum]
MTHLLKKNTPFILSEECIQAFQTLKKKLTEAPILIAPDWDKPFELMCNASDYAIGSDFWGNELENTVGLFNMQVKTMTTAEANYTTTKNKMLDMVTPWFVDYANYHADIIVKEWSTLSRKTNFSKSQTLFYGRPFSIKTHADHDPAMWIRGQEAVDIYIACHSGPTEGHYGANFTAKKVFDLGFNWPTIYKDAHELSKTVTHPAQGKSFQQGDGCHKIPSIM